MIQTEVYISLDGENYSKIDLSKDESILMKYVYKDTAELSKIFSPYSLSFTFPGTLNNQRVFGFVENVKVVKTKTDNVFDCKIYSNGILSQTGKLKLTEIREEFGRVKSYTANFTTTLLSLQTRMGDDLINDLPVNAVTIDWLPNSVYSSVYSIRNASVEPMSGIPAKYYVPLISNTREFQRNANIEVPLIDNVAFNANADPAGNNVLKSDELSPAVQGRTIIDMIKIKYGLSIEMPLESEQYYNDWFIYCNSEKTNANEPLIYDIIKPFGDLVRYRDKDPGHIPNPQKYYISANTNANFFDIFKANADANYDKEVQFFVSFNNVNSTKGGDKKDITLSMVLENGNIYNQITATPDENGFVELKFIIKDADFAANNFKFQIKMTSESPLIWSSSDCKIEFGYYDGKYGPFNRTSYGNWRQSSIGNNNSLAMGGTKIDLYKAIPETKCVDFLTSFFKMFNISVFDASPDDDKLFWLTPQDLEKENKPYSKKEVDYTSHIVSQSVQKKVASDYNYYNFKHKTSKYKSSADYLIARGYEFGQLTYPAVKPTQDLNEFKVETIFSILEALPISGMSDEFTSYGFTNETPATSISGEVRYKPNTTDLTIFFASGQRSLLGDKRLGFQTTNANNQLTITSLSSYIKTSPIHSSGFSFGFGLIQESLIESLYYYFYKKQTEALLNPNALQWSFKLKLPASELVGNYATTNQGESQVPDGFRLQNEIILQEHRFSIIDAQIDVTTGKSDFTLLNFTTSPNVPYEPPVIPPVEPPIEPTEPYEMHYKAIHSLSHTGVDQVTYKDEFNVIRSHQLTRLEDSENNPCELIYGIYISSTGAIEC